MDFEELRTRNDRFRATGAHAELSRMPRRGTVVLGCADPRVDPQQVLGFDLGDVAVVRNIGGRVCPPALATLAGLSRVGPSGRGAPAGPSGPDLIVLHHTDCGIVGLAQDPTALAGFLGIDPELLPFMHVDDPRRAVAHDAELLTAAMPRARVWGLVYDVDTGAIEVRVAPPAALTPTPG
jgi:carbonic anhydrase